MVNSRLMSIVERKRKSLRYNEYYNTQEMFDELYERSKKGHKFKKLLELITTEENILLAYRTIKSNSGSNTSGVNNTTIKDINSWGINKLVNYVRNRLNYYLPQAVRRVYIPKIDGRKRPLGIPTMEDRIIQQCIKQVLEPICEAKFHKHSYGFRPNRSTSHAIARSMFLANKAKMHYVVDIDIKSFFDEVDHAKLLKQLWTLGIQDKRLLSILSRILKSEIKGIGIPNKGTPQGGIISPLLANVVLNELDWWVSDQWETFKTRFNYKTSISRLNSMKKAKNMKLKQIYIVRYADDFKIFCRNYESAVKTKIAVCKWLKERLKLRVNKKKSKVTNLKTTYSKFLGIKFKVRRKGNKFVTKSVISKNVKSKIAYKLKEQIKTIQRNTTVKNVSRLNAMILGMHNYYRMVTDVNMEFNPIAFRVNRILETRLRRVLSKKGVTTETFYKYYGKYNIKPYFIAGIRIFPIAGITNKPPLNFTQDICNYTKKGRELIHNNLKKVSINILKYLMDNPVEGQSVEYNDNRLSRYSGQNGRCYISGEPLTIGNMELHHIKPKKYGGSDNYKNLILVTYKIHKLIHATKDKTIHRYLEHQNFDDKSLAKLNKFRSKIGVNHIEVI